MQKIELSELNKQELLDQYNDLTRLFNLKKITEDEYQELLLDLFKIKDINNNMDKIEKQKIIEDIIDGLVKVSQITPFL